MASHLISSPASVLTYIYVSIHECQALGSLWLILTSVIGKVTMGCYMSVNSNKHPPYCYLCKLMVWQTLQTSQLVGITNVEECGHLNKGITEHLYR